MATANRRRHRSPPATASSSRDPVATASSPYFPPELIPEIAIRLTSLQDFFALRAVLPLTPANLASQAPLLLVPHTGSESHASFHLLLRRIHRFRLPLKRLTAGDHSFTNCHSLGCRLAFYGRRDLHIVHLLTGDRARLPSPPEHSSCVLLSGDLVLAWSYYGKTIQYCRLEAAEWRMASIREPYCFDELIFVNGTLYAMVTPGIDSCQRTTTRWNCCFSEANWMHGLCSWMGHHYCTLESAAVS